MSDPNSGFNVGEEIASELSSEDLTTRVNPLFEGTVPATVTAIKPFKPVDENGVPTGRIAMVITLALQEAIKEYLPEEGLVPREFSPGYTLDQWIDWKCAPDAGDVKRRMQEEARSEFGIATRVVKAGESFGMAQLKDTIGKTVLLKLTVRQNSKTGNFMQNVRFKAPAPAPTTVKAS